MDAPVKFEIPKLSHADVIKLLLPVFPGAVVAINAMAAGWIQMSEFAKLGFGYKSSIVILLAALYACGYVVIFLIDSMRSSIVWKFWPSKTLSLSSDPYWRQLAGEFLGAPCLPDNIKMPSQIIYANLQPVLGSDPEAEKSATELDEKIAALDQKVNALTKRANELPESSEKTRILQSVDKLQKKHQEFVTERRYRQEGMIRDMAWLRLESALSIMDDTDSPYEGYEAIMAALFAGAVTQLLLIFSVHPGRSIPIAIFSVILLATTGNTRWQIYSLSRTFGEFGALPIAFLLTGIKKRKPNEC